MRKSNVGMFLDIYELIWFKVGVMVDAIVLNIFVLIWLTLTLIQGHMNARKQKLLRQFSTKFSVN